MPPTFKKNRPVWQLENLVNLFMQLKIKKLFQIFDAGECFSLGQEVDEETEEITWKAVVIKEEGIKNDDEKK